MNSELHVPVLETERLRLRGHCVSDFPHLAAMWSDPDVTRYTVGKPLSEEDSWSRLLRYVGHWSLQGFGYWLIEEKTTAGFIGEIGFADYKRDMTPSLKGMPESGWVLARHAQGKGYATEAAQAAVAWGDRYFGSAQTACLIDPENTASIRVAGKCGYAEWRRATYRNRPTIVFIRTPPASPGPMHPGYEPSLHSDRR
jgi:RimJ/RimL family protein N-acetyltransferase